MTLDIMLLVVASIVFFEFQPLTAVMIVVLALLDDIPIMTIAYDNVSARAEAGTLGHAPRACVFVPHGAAVARRELRPAVDRPAMDRAIRAAGDIASIDVSCRPWCSCSSRSAGICCCSSCAPSVRSSAALSERASVLRHRRDADRGTADLRLRVLVPKLPARGDRRRLDLFARLDGRDRYRQSCLLASSPRIGIASVSGPRSVFDRLNEKEISVNLAKRLKVTPAASSSSPTSIRFSRHA